MAYTPNNNPYVPGDPYSYDLKWIVDELKYAISLYQPLHDEFEQVKDEFDDLKNFINNYFDTLDLSAEVSAVIDRMRRDGYFDTLVYNIVTNSGTIESVTEQWLADNITPTSPAVDASLSINGAAADAEAVGQFFRSLGIPYYEKSTEQGAWGPTGDPIVLTTRIRTQPIASDNIKTVTFLDPTLDYYIVYLNRALAGTGNSGWKSGANIVVDIPDNTPFIKISMRNHNAPDSALAPRTIAFIATPASGNPLKNIQTNVAVADYDEDRYANTICRVVGTDTAKMPTSVTIHYVINLRNGFSKTLIAFAVHGTRLEPRGMFIKTANTYQSIEQPWCQIGGTALLGSADIDSAEVFRYRIVVIDTLTNFDNLPDEYNNARYVFTVNIPYAFTNATTVNYNQFIFRNSLSMYYRAVTVNKDTGVAAVIRDWTPFTDTVPKGKKWYILGDSIAAGYYSLTDAEAAEQGVTIVYRPAGLSGVGAAWDRSLGHNYMGYINNWVLKERITNLAHPAQGYRHLDADNQNGISIVDLNDFSDADLITVAYGFNDWHYNVPIGDTNITDSTTDDGTTSWAVRHCLKTLATKAPHAKIIILLPLNGWLYGGDTSTNWGMGYAMSNSGTLEQVSNIIKYWADYYGLDIIDLGHNNSVVNRINIQTAEVDGSHPTDETHKKLAMSIWTKLGF